MAKKYKWSAEQPIETTVTILHIYDGDASPEEYLFQDEDYRAEDQKRLDDWKNDQWYFIGIKVRVLIHNWSTGNSQSFESAGLWGIESDSEDEYLRQVAEEQLAELQHEYPQLKGVTLIDAEIKEKAA